MIFRSNSIALITGCGLMLCLVPLTARASAVPDRVLAPETTLETAPTANWLAAPLEGVSTVRSFLAPNSDYSAGHRGIDYAVPPAAQLVAPTTGSIHFNGLVANRNVVTIKRSNGHLVSLEPVCSNLAVGKFINVGQPLGQHCPGSAGYRDHCEKLAASRDARVGPGSTLRCLHFSYRTERGYLSPDAVMGLLTPSRLAPWRDV